MAVSCITSIISILVFRVM